MVEISEDAVPTQTTSRTTEEQDRALTAPVPDTLDGGDGLADPLSSVGIISSSGDTEVAYTGTFTKQLVEAMKDPDEPLDDIMDRLSEERFTAKGSDDEGAPSQGPTIARLGKGTAEGTGKKKAVVIGNKSYKSLDGSEDHFLPSAKDDATSMAGALQSRDYATELLVDEDATSMAKHYSDAVTDSALVPGDAVTLYFSGHGTPLGPVGTGATYQGFHHVADPAIYSAGPIPNTEILDSGRDVKRRKLGKEFDGAFDEPTKDELAISDIMPNSVLTGLVGEATGRGLHLRIILDACFSGQSTDTVRDEFLTNLSESSTDPTVTAGVKCAEALDDWKGDLSEWRRKLTVDRDGDEGWWKATAQPAIAALTAEFTALTGEALTPPAASLDPIAQIAEIHAMIDRAINAMIAKLQAMIDGEDD